MNGKNLVVVIIVGVLAVFGAIYLFDEANDSDLENAAEDVGDAIDDAADEIDDSVNDNN
ncbi:hypothetical protein PUV54_13970 [Hyphococcus flavus]|uniref:Uncharacterized protein n=1 Tax=Hyphococcus flavus TaxID=1866326 RepID=A0AAE9ZAZ4_9PROT|nr:hypothetical protein [Hyphococcus flavus]WDI31058.1 hypothetical protein PUV54_13970 [Hyphococcus flavus]